MDKGYFQTGPEAAGIFKMTCLEPGSPERQAVWRFDGQVMLYIMDHSIIAGASIEGRPVVRNSRPNFDGCFRLVDRAPEHYRCIQLDGARLVYWPAEIECVLDGQTFVWRANDYFVSAGGFAIRDTARLPLDIWRQFGVA